MLGYAQSILELAPPEPGEKISYGRDENQFGELRLPEGAGLHPLAIVIHGGYWRARYDLKHIGHLCVALNKEGFATWSLEYRRLGNPGGGWPGTLDDVRAGASHIEKIAAARRIDLKRTIALGHSAGGQLVLWLAKQRAIELRGIVPLAPVADLRRAWELKLSSNVVEEFLGGSPNQVPERYRAASPVEFAPVGIRTRILHGEADDVVPVAFSRTYVAAAKKAGDDALLIEPKGAGHFELIDPVSPKGSAAWSELKKAALSLVR